jgi:hypothetical protein
VSIDVVVNVPPPPPPPPPPLIQLVINLPPLVVNNTITLPPLVVYVTYDPVNNVIVDVNPPVINITIPPGNLTGNPIRSLRINSDLTWTAEVDPAKYPDLIDIDSVIGDAENLWPQIESGEYYPEPLSPQSSAPLSESMEPKFDLLSL